MATNGRGTNRSVESHMYSEGFRYEFYQAVRLFEILQNSTANPVGQEIDPALEAVRFKSSIGLDFPPTDIADIRPINEGERRAEITVNFLGLAGHFGPMPPTYTELIIERMRKKDTAMREFLDVFNHRILSIFYRVRKKHRVGFEYKHPADSHFARYLFSLIGLGTEDLLGRLGVNDYLLLGYAGLIAQKPRSSVGLRTILQNFFGFAVEVRSFGGKWYPLEEGQITKLGVHGINNALGKTALVGARVWDQHANIELAFSNLTFNQFQSLLPTGKLYAKLIALTEFYVGREVGFRISLELDSKFAPPLVLGGKARLGWMSRLGTTAEAEPHNISMTTSPRQFASIMKNVAGKKDPEFAAAAAKFPDSLLENE